MMRFIVLCSKKRIIHYY